MKLKDSLAYVILLAGTSLIGYGRVGVGVVVGTAPPAPLVVAGPVGVAPGPAYVWVDGYWDWVGGRWVWVPGRWMLQPRPRAVWIGPIYRPEHEHIRYIRGHWR